MVGCATQKLDFKPGVTPSLENRYSCWKTSQAALVVKNPPANAGSWKRHGFDHWIGKLPWRRARQPTPMFLPGESHGQRCLEGHRVRHDWSDLARIHAKIQASRIFHVGPPDGVVLSLLMCWDNSNHSLWPTPKTSDILGRVHVPIPTWQINEAKSFRLRDWPLFIQLTGNRAVIQNQAWARNLGALSTIQVQLDKAHFINSVLLLTEHIGLPWSSTSFECACQCRGHGFDPWSGKIPHVVGHISQRATATEPVCCNYWSLHTQSLFSAMRSHCKETPMHDN